MATAGHMAGRMNGITVTNGAGSGTVGMMMTDPRRPAIPVDGTGRPGLTMRV